MESALDSFILVLPALLRDSHDGRMPTQDLIRLSILIPNGEPLVKLYYATRID